MTLFYIDVSNFPVLNLVLIYLFSVIKNVATLKYKIVSTMQIIIENICRNIDF